MIEATETFIVNHTVAILLIVLAAYIAQKFIMTIVAKIIRRSIQFQHRGHHDVHEEKREKTLIDIIGTALKLGIWLMAGLMILQEVGVNIAPLLAGAGVAGIALGFGAQSLVQDAFRGLFIIFENQYRVGDVVQINGDLAGVVEKITLRATVLRDLDGYVHHVSNGNIQTATNMTMEFANVNIDIGVSYDSDLEEVEKVINQVGETMAEEEEWKHAIITPPAFLRLDEFDDSSLQIKILGKTTADMRWSVAGEYRRRLKEAFDKHDIEIPFPQMVIHDKRAKKDSKK
jgi:moderate conductance mechanosensitive channel